MVSFDGEKVEQELVTQSMLPIQDKINKSAWAALLVTRRPWMMETFEILKRDVDDKKTRRRVLFDPWGTILFYYLLRGEESRLAEENKKRAWHIFLIYFAVALFVAFAYSIIRAALSSAS